MRSRRDQLEAHRFVSRRMVYALLSGEPETKDLPMRRLGFATFGGVMVAVLAVAVVGVFGFIKPGGASNVRDEKALIVEKETGTRYVYSNNWLYPVANYSSALLILGGAPTERRVSRKSLTGIPRGHLIGIPGAPDALPDPGLMVGLPWTACSTEDPKSATHNALVAVVVGRRFAGTDASGWGLLARSGSTLYLLWHGSRLRLTNSDALSRLGWANQDPIAVGSAFLNAVPAGPDLAPPEIAGTGGAAADGRKVGEVLVVGDDQYFVALSGGRFGAINEVQAQLLLAAPGYPGAERAGTKVDVAPLNVERVGSPPGFPSKAPLLMSVDTTTKPAICEVYGDRGSTTLTVVTKRPDVLVERDPLLSTAVAVDGVLRADRVVVPPSGGALVRAQPAPDVTTGTLYLVTDQGVKYPLASENEVEALGYKGVHPVSIPTSVLELMPSGPPLDAERAKHPADMEGGSGTPSSAPSN